MGYSHPAPKLKNSGTSYAHYAIVQTTPTGCPTRTAASPNTKPTHSPERKHNMRVAKLSREQMQTLLYALQQAHNNYEEFRLAYDGVDEGIKFKVSTFPWSPPIRTENR